MSDWATNIKEWPFMAAGKFNQPKSSRAIRIFSLEERLLFIASHASCMYDNFSFPEHH